MLAVAPVQESFARTLQLSGASNRLVLGLVESRPHLHEFGEELLVVRVRRVRGRMIHSQVKSLYLARVLKFSASRLKVRPLRGPILLRR